MNFLKETLVSIVAAGQKPEDVVWIGSNDGEYAMTWEEFKERADFEYDNSYGAQHIAQDLIVVFKDNTWLERGEYDGSEWWEYNGFAPKKKPNAKPIKNLGGPSIMWDTVEELNTEKPPVSAITDRRDNQ